MTSLYLMATSKISQNFEISSKVFFVFFSIANSLFAFKCPSISGYFSLRSLAAYPQRFSSWGWFFQYFSKVFKHNLWIKISLTVTAFRICSSQISNCQVESRLADAQNTGIPYQNDCPELRILLAVPDDILRDYR